MCLWSINSDTNINHEYFVASGNQVWLGLEMRSLVLSKTVPCSYLVL